MKHKLIAILFILRALIVNAHDAHQDHHVPLRQWNFIGQSKTVEGSFFLYRDNTVFIENADSKILKFPISSLQKEDRDYVLDKYKSIQELNQIHLNQNPSETKQINVFFYQFWIVFFLLMIMGAYFYHVGDKKKPIYAVPIVVALLMFTFFSFTNKQHHIFQLTTNPLFIDSAFVPFKPNVFTRWDANYFYVESRGIPTTHPMMLGITAWQQQVPIPQCYTGTNAWSIPLNPVIAPTPVPVNPQHFLRGAVAIAVNGIAIFNPFTNTGVDAFLDGQLDQYGGHCGRADDYHYHTAPLDLYKYTVDTLPIAFALDGFAVYGAKEPDGNSMKPLDVNHGHYGSNGVYHYHGTNAAPYMIGNMVGKVTEDATMQIIPQAAAKPIRPAGTPLKGATIIDCVPNGKSNGYTLNYTLNNQKYAVEYSWAKSGQYTFNFINPNGTTTSNYNGYVDCALPTSASDLNDVGHGILVFPNPVNHLLSIQIDESISENEISDIGIFNLSGESVFHSDHFVKHINMDDFPNGMYFLKCQINDKLFKQLFLKQ